MANEIQRALTGCPYTEGGHVTCHPLCADAVASGEKRICNEHDSAPAVRYCEYGTLGHWGLPDAGWYVMRVNGGEPAPDGPYSTEAAAYAARDGKRSKPSVSDEAPF